MRSLRIWLSVSLAAGLMAVALTSVHAQDTTITEAHAALNAALDQKDFPAVWKQCHLIMDAVAKRGPDTLTAPETYALAVGHYYLVAETLDKVLKMDGLSAEQIARATTMRDQIMGVSQQPAAAAVPAPAAPVAEVAKVRVISHGQQVTLEDYVVPGKSTIIDFYSEFCPPCRALSPKLEKLVNDRTDVVLVKVDINRPGTKGIDWQSPVAGQYKLRGIPYLRVYGTDGKLQAEGDDAHEIINGWLNGGQ